VIYFITVNYFSSHLITKLIHSIPKNSKCYHQFIIVNNSPDDASLYQMKTDDIIILESETNLGFGRACNLGLNWIYKQDNKATVWLINPDSYLLENALEKATKFLESYSELSILGTTIYKPTEEIWFAGGRFIPKTGTIISETVVKTNLDLAYTDCDWVSGCSMLINFRKFKSCPEFDPAYFLYYEDFDFCLRYANQGHLVVITSNFGVVHQPSSITNRKIFDKFKHSTYSYLLTLERHTKFWVRARRLIRLIFHAIILIFIKPSVGFGKLYGVLLYFKS